MTEVPTVKIKRPDNPRGGYAIINEADFDPKKHELFDAPAKAPAKDPGNGDGGDGDGNVEPPKSAAEILAMLEDSSVHYSTAQAEAKKLLGDDNTPAKKVELIEALKARAAADAAA